MIIVYINIGDYHNVHILAKKFSSRERHVTVTTPNTDELLETESVVTVIVFTSLS